MDTVTIQLWGVLGTWFSGFFTCAAVLLSLWFGIYKNKAKLGVHAGLRKIYLNGTPELDYCVISITNKSQIPVNITLIGWKIGKNYYQQLFPSTFPILLNPGDFKDLQLPLYPTNNFSGFLDETFKSIQKSEIKTKTVKNIKVIVGTSIGQSFKKKIEPILAEKIIEYMSDSGKDHR
ncbi:hypothetical protein [Dethiosulfatarculus sandiegensis]|uniref:Uncharacterized protein n=1 Tax=Dethiosulfatarculus sandiegensis TaxID=1429043 RepID=A0A0D2J0B2_9BACT|nr:hypothetical protein [Dethiosulfatarculus sandiegensis]KIX11679.1 hypothetical protein X474_23080 [Dethiosulfatarculus sandiegensis]